MGLSFDPSFYTGFCSEASAFLTVKSSKKTDRNSHTQFLDPKNLVPTE